MFLDLFLAILSTLRGAEAYVLDALLLFTSGIGGPFSQDALLLASAGFGTIDPTTLVVLAWVAFLAADAFSLWLGHRYGARWIRRPWARGIVAPERLPGLEEKMRRHGVLLSFVTRFLPGQRATLYFLYGTLRLPYRPFFLGDGLAALIQVPLFVYGVRSLGWQWQALRPRFDRVDDVLTVILVVALLFLLLRKRGPNAA